MSSSSKPSQPGDARSLGMRERAAAIEAAEEAKPGLDVETREDELLDDNSGADAGPARHAGTARQFSRPGQPFDPPGLSHQQ